MAVQQQQRPPFGQAPIGFGPGAVQDSTGTTTAAPPSNINSSLASSNSQTGNTNNTEPAGSGTDNGTTTGSSNSTGSTLTPSGSSEVSVTSPATAGQQSLSQSPQLLSINSNQHSSSSLETSTSNPYDASRSSIISSYSRLTGFYSGHHTATGHPYSDHNSAFYAPSSANPFYTTLGHHAYDPLLKGKLSWERPCPHGACSNHPLVSLS